jgi:hypothetical protein
LRNETNPFVYWLAGLRIDSEIELPILTRWDGRLATQGAARISRGPLKDYSIADAVPFAGGSCKDKELLFAVPEVARFLIRNGDDIVIDAEAGAGANDIAAYLLGSVFGVLCHQRGIVPIHGSAIDVDGESCVAFVGDSGAGKSTLSAALAARGHQVISDDVCFLVAGDDLKVWPGIGRIRLWEDSLTALKLGASDAVREYDGWDKFVVPLAPPPQLDRPRHLARIYQLRSSGSEPTIMRVRGAAAIDLIMRNVYRAEYADLMGRQQAIFSRCAPLARHVPVFEFDRPIGFDLLGEGVEFLLRHIEQAL